MENRETFFQRLRPRYSPSQMLDVELAYMLTKFGHRAQVRNELDADGEPVRYFEHLRRVTLILTDEVKIFDRDMVCASLLHDSLEDTRDLTPELLEHCFGTNVVSIVKTLSKTPKECYLERFMSSNDWQPYVIKACDRLDNLRSLEQSSETFQIKQVKETYEKYFPLIDRMVALGSSIYNPTHDDRLVTLRQKVIDQTEMLARKLSISLS